MVAPGRLREGLARPARCARRGSRRSRPRSRCMQANIKRDRSTPASTNAPLRPVRRHGRREAGRGRRDDHPDGHELLARPVGGRDDRQPRATWTSRPTSPRTCCRGSPLGQPAEVSVSAVPEQALPGPAPPDHPHGRPHPRHGQGEGRDPRPRRQALPRAGGHRPLPARQDGDQADASKSFLFVPKAAVFQENGHDLRLGRGRRSRRSASGRSRWPRPRKTWPASRPASRPARRSSSTRPKALQGPIEEVADRRMTRMSPSRRFLSVGSREAIRSWAESLVDRPA